eukprot:403341255
MNGRRHFASSAFGLNYDKANDYYEILGVSQKCNEKDLKKAYYKLAQKYHPDKAGAADKKSEEKFKMINNAYDLLKDEQNRKLYDQLREEAKNPKAAQSGFDQSYSGPQSSSGKRSQSSNTSNGNFYKDYKSQEDYYKHYADYKNTAEKTKDFFKNNKWTGGYWDDGEGSNNSSKRQQQQYQQQQQNSQDFNKSYHEQNTKNQYEDFQKRAGEGQSKYSGSQYDNKQQSTHEQDEFYRQQYQAYQKAYQEARQKTHENSYKKAANANNNFQDFKKSRDIKKPEPKVYKKYTPSEDSTFNYKNRGFNQPEYRERWFTNLMMNKNPFEIKDFQKQRKTTENDDLFEGANTTFKSQTHESMERDEFNLTEVNKMIPAVRVLAGLGLLGVTYKVVDAYTV